MERKKLFKMIGIFIVLAALVIVAWISITGFLNKPLAPPLVLVTPVAAPQARAQPETAEETSDQPLQTEEPAPAVQETAEIQATEEVEVPTIQNNDQGMCGMTGKMTLMASGVSLPTRRNKQDIGAIRLVGVDFEAGKIMVLALPPRMQVDTPALAVQGVQVTELRNVFLLAREAAKRGESQPNFVATQVLAQTLVDNFGFFSDHYATVDPEVFIEIVDEFGGLDVKVPEYLDASAEGYGIFEAGLEHMDGARVLDYVSLKKPNGAKSPDEWARLKRQDLIVRVMLKTAIRLENLPKIPKLIEMFKRLVITDLSINQLKSLACMVTEMGVNVDLVGFSPELVSVDTQGGMVPDVEKVKALIGTLTAGQ